jgi:hypothetical protein
MVERTAACKKSERQAVDISRLKLWATRNLSPTSNLRKLLLLEKELMTPDEFIAKTGTWLKLARLEEPYYSVRAQVKYDEASLIISKGREFII